MIVEEIKSYIELANLARNMENLANHIETGDAHFNIACIERFPYFDGAQLQEKRNKAIKEYLQMLIKAFVCSCKFIIDATEPIVFEAIDSSVVYLCDVIASRKVQVQLLPMAKPLYDMYNEAYAKLLRSQLKENATHLEKLKKSIFHGWVPIYG
jgi:hypothetical protein